MATSIDHNTDHRIKGSPRPYVKLFDTRERTRGTNTGRRILHDERAYPPVVWLMRVYSETDERLDENTQGQNAGITYMDDKPFQFSICKNNAKSALHQFPLNGKGSIEEPIGGKWTRPVISIETLLKADFSTEVRSSPPKSLDPMNPSQDSRKVMVILSPYLIFGFQGLIGYYPSFNRFMSYSGTTQAEFRIEEPFAVLLHHFKDIESFVGNGKSSAFICGENSLTKTTGLIKEHMKHLLGYLKPIYEDSVPRFERMLCAPSPRVRFDMIWYLLKPGTDVYVRAYNPVYVAVVMEVRRTSTGGSTIWDDMRVYGSWTIDSWQLETDGSQIRRGLTSHEIPYFLGSKEVTDLAICPVEIWDAKDGGTRRQEILNRNKISFKALKHGNLIAEYEGPLEESGEFVRRQLSPILCKWLTLKQ